MAEIGIFFLSEERSASEIVDAAVRAERAGFRSAWLSDHFHPWNDEQGHSPFVWSVLGAVAHATREMRWMTAVTCPTVRTHPGIVAHAAATTEADVRLEMLEEAVEVIRMLWEGGFKHHHGRHYTLEGARLYSLPEQPPPILVSGFGPKAVERAARIGDGFVSIGPRSERLSMPASTRSTSATSETATTASSTSTPARSCRTSRARRRPAARDLSSCGY